MIRIVDDMNLLGRDESRIADTRIPDELLWVTTTNHHQTHHRGYIDMDKSRAEKE